MTTQPTEAPLRMVRFSVPFTPPSVNHYKKPKRSMDSQGNMRTSFYVTAEGMKFKQAVGFYARGRTIAPTDIKEQKKARYSLAITIVHGPKEFGDADNYPKCVADGLEDAGVIHSDMAVKVLYVRVVDDDRENPRTVIRVARIDRPEAPKSRPRKAKP